MGASPGALAPGSGATRLNVIAYRGDELVERTGVRVDELAALARPGWVLWLEVEGLGDEPLLRELAARLHVHPLALADIVNVGQRPKAEAYPEFELIICRAACPRGPAELELEQVSLVLARDLVVSFHEGARDLFEPVRERIRRGAGLVRTAGADYLAYALVDVLVDGYFPFVDALSERLETLEEKLVSQPTQALLSDIHRGRREILSLVRIVHQQRDAVSAMMRADHPLISDATRVYLRDSLDHALQVSDVLDTLREMALGLLDVYHSSISQRTNEIIKVLTILSTIFIPLTFIVGVYGMNFEHMPELHWRYGYVVAWTLMLAVALGLLWLFRRVGWIGGERPPPD